MLETFRDDRGFVRYDWSVRGYALYGVGRYRTYNSGFSRMAWRYFLNSYRWAPLPVRLVSTVGLLDKPGYQWPTPRVAFSGSVVRPRASWAVRVGRVFVGGDTPGFVQRWLSRRDARRYANLEAPDWAGGSDEA